MNINDYRRGMDKILPDPKLKERIMKQTNEKKKYIPVRRVVNGLLAAALAAACLFTAALAASPDLRTAMLSFFHMEEREQVPSSSVTAKDPDISQTEIGALVKAQYVKMDRYYGHSGSLFYDLTWSGDNRTLLDAKFWEVKENELVPIEVELNTNTVAISYDGIRYQGELYWFVRDSQLFVTKGNPLGIEMMPEDEWYIQPISGRTDVVILNLAQGRQMEYTEYPVLYHLDTGEMEDILSETGASELEHAYSYLWSEDMRRVLISCGEGPNGQQEWLCDLEAKTLTSLDEVTGLDGEVTANFMDSETLILTKYTKDAEGLYQSVTCYSFHLISKQLVKTLNNAPYYRWFDEEPYGAMLFGSRCVLIGLDGQVQVIDLSSGERTAVEGFSFQHGDDFMISPSQDKLLYYHAAPQDIASLGVAQLGVIDLKLGTFIAFDREGFEHLQEEGIGWEDDNTVSINAHTPDYETQYLLMYQF